LFLSRKTTRTQISAPNGVLTPVTQAPVALKKLLGRKGTRTYSGALPGCQRAVALRAVASPERQIEIDNFIFSQNKK
jgi:hypothetical protein